MSGTSGHSWEERKSVLGSRAAPPELCTVEGKGMARGKRLCLGISRSAMYPHPPVDFQTHRTNTADMDHNTKVTMISPYFTDTWAQTGCQGCGRSNVYKYKNEPRVLQCPKHTAERGDRKLPASSWNWEAIPPSQAEPAACKAGSDECD